MVSRGRRAGIYARLSQDRGLEKVSVPRQIDECRVLAERNGWEVVEVFEDRDVSASNRNAKRPGYDALLEALRSGRINAVLARETSRLYRRPRQLEDLIDLIEGKGVEIATVYEGEVDLSTSNGRMMARIRVSVDKAESERLSERTRSAKKEARANGKWLGGGRRPYGYDIIDEPDQPRRFVINKDEAKVVRELARRITSGETLHRVTLDLNQRGVTTAGGKRWRPAHVKRLLERDLPPAFPPILKEDERLVVVGRLANMTTKKGRPEGARKYILSGLALCASCNTKMTGTGGKSGTAHGGYYFESYRCDFQDGGCGKSIGARRLEAFVRQELSETDIILKRPRVVSSSDDDAVIAEMKEIGTRLEALASNLDLTERQLAARSRALEARYEELQSKLAVPQDAAPTEPKWPLLFTWIAQGNKPGLPEAKVLAIRDAIAAVIRRIKVRPRNGAGEDLSKRVEIEWR